MNILNSMIRTAVAFLLFSFCSNAQQVIGGYQVPEYYIPYSHSLVLNNTLKKEKGKNNFFKRTYPYNSSGLELHADSSFVYYYVSDIAYEVSAGKYSMADNVITLNWDSLKTENTAIEPDFYREYFKSKKPTPFKIQNVKYILMDNELIPYRSYTNENRIEFIYRSGDLFKRNKGVNNFKDIAYNKHGNRLIISYGKDQEMVLRADSIWGFAIYKNHKTQVYRRTAKGLNWYGIPGVQIAQLDKLIIYTVGEDRMYSYFSENLDSKIYALTMRDVEKLLRKNKELMLAIYKAFGRNGPLTTLDDYYYNSYKFIEVYRTYKK
jgi:hypothetical protein